LEPFSRKIADAHYNLGLSYLSHSGELQKEDTSSETNTRTTSDYANRQKLSHEMCRKGMECYVACAKALCGQMALLCGVEASSVLTNSTQGKAGFKTTGLDDDAPVSSSDASQTLSVWRRNVADLSPLEAGDPTVEDLRQLLDEIQETVDEAERSQDAVRQATQMKVQAQNAITKSDEAELSGGTTAINPWANITTTIGFDKPTMDAKPAAAAAVGQTPMMVVKKKKKRDVTTTEGEDAKPSADAKRAKTE
jgi:hypothetical protein